MRQGDEPPSLTTPSDPVAVLRTVFGHERFRTPQDQVIEHVTAGGDAVVLMPTGGGKSLCYQIPALCRPGTALVISPLIALMRAQVRSLQAKGVAAAALHSGLAPEETTRVLASLANGALDLLYVAPERAASPAFLHALGSARLALIALDEAHCVSQWGHDFRPAYQTLGPLMAARPDTPRLALTGTADHRTLDDIKRHLWLDKARVFQSGFARPNITLSLLKDHGNRLAYLIGLIEENGARPALIYCRTRKGTESIAARLTKQGVPATAYHAGLESAERAAAEARFLTGAGQVMVATVAFGMGMDRPDIGLVVHLDSPDSLEAYWQEVGRAGRDGQPARAVLAFGMTEMLALRRRALEDPDCLLGTHPGAKARLDAMIAYGESTDCRARAIARYFGEPETAPCGTCDLCQAPPKTVDGSEAAAQLLQCLSDAPRPLGPSQLVKELADHGPATLWQSVIRQMIARDLITPASRTTAGLIPTPAGYDHLMRRPALPLIRDWSEDNRPVSEKTGLSDEALAELRKIRDALADDLGLPALLICHDRALEAIARARPQTLNDLETVPGMTAQKAERFGPALLEAIRAA